MADTLQITTSNLERIANPLSVVHGYAQLLRRQLERDGNVDPEMLKRVVLLIEAASSALVDEVKAARKQHR